MKRRRVSLVFLAILLAAVAVASCQKSYHRADEKYFYIAANINLPYWQEAKAGFLDAAAALGVKAEFTGPTSHSPDEQLTFFHQALKQQPAGILLSATRPDLFKTSVDAAIAQGIPVICADGDVPDSRRALFVGTDNVRGGREGARRLAELLRGQGRIVVITILGQANLDDRVRGVNEVLQKYPGLKLVQMFDDKGDPRIANDQISALLERKEKIDGILCLEASGGPGAAEALHRLNMTGRIAIVAFDKEPETFDWIERGVITATIAQKPYTMSYYGLKFLDDLHHNAVREFKDWRTAPVSPMPAWVDTGTAIVDKGNLAAFREAVATRPKIF